MLRHFAHFCIGEELPNHQSRQVHGSSRTSYGRGSAGSNLNGAHANMQHPSGDLSSVSGHARRSDARKHRQEAHASTCTRSAREASNEKLGVGEADHSLRHEEESRAQDAASGHGSVNPMPLVVDPGVMGANMSVAAQLRAKLQGKPMPSACSSKARLSDTAVSIMYQ